MHRWLTSLMALGLAACALVPAANPPATEGEAAIAPLPDSQMEIELKNYGPAPELTNDVWLNVDQPLRLADLRGRVVLIDMWTFG